MRVEPCRGVVLCRFGDSGGQFRLTVLRSTRHSGPCVRQEMRTEGAGPHGTVAQRPYRVVGDRGIGPGAGDDKAGIVTAVCALRILHELNYRDYALITLILNSNEETGSVGTRDLIRAKAKESDAVINLE